MLDDVGMLRIDQPIEKCAVIPRVDADAATQSAEMVANVLESQLTGTAVLDQSRNVARSPRSNEGVLGKAKAKSQSAACVRQPVVVS